MSFDDCASFSLVMPFVTVRSTGGPHDDDAYTAGWEMGALDAELRCTMPPILERTIHLANARQADLIAMKHGYAIELADPQGDWVHMRLTRFEEPS